MGILLSGVNWRWFLVFAILVPSYSLGQQYRMEQPPHNLSIDSVQKWRFLSTNPPRPISGSHPFPGSRLQALPAARTARLKARIAAARHAYAASRTSNTTPSVPYPGILFRPFIPAGATPASVVTGDFNNDGHIDYVIANGLTNDLWIYLGKGDGTFQLPEIIPLTRGLSPVYLATADLRGNGKSDLVVAEFDTSTVGVLLGNGDGTFAFEKTYTLPQPPSAVVIDDFNHDGKLDIASVMYTVSSDITPIPYLATLIGDGTGSFGTSEISFNPGFGSTAMNISSGDVNNDGFTDVIIAGPGNEGSQIYLNNGDGTFKPGAFLVGTGPVNIVLDARLADFNGDGCLDAGVADFNGFVWTLLGDCAGNFASPNFVQTGEGNAALRLVDMNGDGHVDLVTSPIFGDLGYGDVSGDTVSVSFGDGHGKFTTGRNYVGNGQAYSLAIGVFNGDGKPDVVTSNIDTNTASVYLNDGSGGFGAPQGLFVGLPGIPTLNAPVSPVSFPDLNSDGKPDVFLFNEGFNFEYYATSFLNDGTGRLTAPIVTDTGINLASNWMGDYRLADFRNTGHPDLVAIGLTKAASSSASYIFFLPGNGDGTFGKGTYLPTPGADGAMAVGDFNRDGKLDFVAVDANSTLNGKQIMVFLGNGDGTFRSGAATNFADTAEEVARVFAADFNRDGKLDILVYTTGNGYWTLNTSIWEFLGNGDGTFQPGRQLFTPFQPMTLADVNGDGYPDIVRYDFFWPDGTTQTYGPARFTTYLDQPDGTFSQSSSYAPYAGIPSEVIPFLQDGDPTAVSIVADLNGDGKPDEVSFQTNSQSDISTYAQILMGKGDGTLTPTYDVFAFDKIYSYPKYGHDLNGDGFTDLLELDQFTSSLHIFQGGPAPLLQLELEQTIVSSDSGCGWVFLNVPSNSDTVVTLSSSVSGVNLPGSVTVSSGSLSQQFCYSLASGFDWHHVFDIRAKLGTDTEVAYASQTYVVGFSEALSPLTPLVVYPSLTTAPVTITLTSSQGYSSTANFSCQGLVPGLSCTFASNTLAVSPSSPSSTTVVINTTSSASAGQFTIFVVADDGVVEKWQPLLVTIQPLYVNLYNNPGQATSPGSATGALDINGIPPYQPSCAGLPAGATCTFSGTQSPYPDSTQLALSVAVPAGLAAGNYPFTVSVESSGITTTANTTLAIVDFSLLAPTAASDWAVPGTTAYVTFGIQPINNLIGNVTVTCSFDFGGTCTGGSFPAVPGENLVGTIPSGLSSGPHTLTVVGTYGPITHTASYPFAIADFGGSLSTSSVSVAQGGQVPVTLTLKADAPFSGVITLSCSSSSQLFCNFQQSVVQLTGGTPLAVNMTVSASASASTRPQHKVPVWFALVLVPLGLTFASLHKQGGHRGAGIVLVLACLLCCLSCGGGSGSGSSGGGGTGGGSNHYSLTVTANDSYSKVTRQVGTLSVTVTH
jgi:hypothetical protein